MATRTWATPMTADSAAATAATTQVLRSERSLSSSERKLLIMLTVLR